MGTLPISLLGPSGHSHVSVSLPRVPGQAPEKDAPANTCSTSQRLGKALDSWECSVPELLPPPGIGCSARAMEIGTFRELLEVGAGFWDSSATSAPCAGRENSWAELSQSCESTRESCSPHPAQQSCTPTPGANPTVLTVEHRIRLPLEAKGLGICRQTNNGTLLPPSTGSVGRCLSWNIHLPKCASSPGNLLSWIPFLCLLQPLSTPGEVSPTPQSLDLGVPQDQHPEIPTGPAGLGLEQWDLSSRSSSHGKGVQQSCGSWCPCSR